MTVGVHPDVLGFALSTHAVRMLLSSIAVRWKSVQYQPQKKVMRDMLAPCGNAGLEKHFFSVFRSNIMLA
jgi:hypothetical protein